MELRQVVRAEEAQEFASGNKGKLIEVAVLILIALLSFFLVGEHLSSPDAHTQTIQVLDQKKDTVMGLVAGSSAVSVGVSFLPGDAGSPIANKLVDLSSDFLIVLAAIYLEKYLLTILGFLTFKVLIPLGCVLLAVALFLEEEGRPRKMLVNLASKMVLFGLAVFIAVPASVWVSSMIDSTYESSVAQTLAIAEDIRSDSESSTSAVKDAEDVKEAADDASTAEQGFLDTVTGFFKGVPDTISSLSDEARSLVAQAQTALNDFIEALAVMIVTSCVIPILVLLFFLWLAKSILGIDVKVPLGHSPLRGLGVKSGK